MITPILHWEGHILLESGNNSFDGVPLEHHVVKWFSNKMGLSLMNCSKGGVHATPRPQ